MARPKKTEAKAVLSVDARKRMIAQLLRAKPPTPDDRIISIVQAAGGTDVTEGTIKKQIKLAKRRIKLERNERIVEEVEKCLVAKLPDRLIFEHMQIAELPLTPWRLYNIKKQVQAIREERRAASLSQHQAEQLADLVSMERVASNNAALASQAGKPIQHRRWEEHRLKIKDRIFKLLGLETIRPIEVPEGTRPLGMIPITQIVVERTTASQAEETDEAE